VAAGLLVTIKGSVWCYPEVCWGKRTLQSSVVMYIYCADKSPPYGTECTENRGTSKWWLKNAAKDRIGLLPPSLSIADEKTSWGIMLELFTLYKNWQSHNIVWHQHKNIVNDGESEKNLFTFSAPIYLSNDLHK
jgi:hypothetical protein